MNIFKREMRRSVKGLLLWCFGMVAMLGAGMGKYAGLQATAGTLNAMVALYPAPLRVLFGVGDFDLGTPMGFYGVLYLFLLLIAGVHATMLGANILAKEERDRTAEFLLVKPISRPRIMAYKYGAALLQILLLNLVAWAVGAAALLPYLPQGGYGMQLAALMGGMLLFQTVFLAVGAACAALMRKAERAAALASYVLVATFLLSLFAGLYSGLDFLQQVSPFGVFAARHVLIEGGLPWWAFAYALALVGGCMGVAFWRYPKRDIEA